MAKVELTISGLPKFDKRAISKEQAVKFLGVEANNQVFRIRKALSAGQGVDGEALKDYSAGYKRQIERAKSQASLPASERKVVKKVGRKNLTGRLGAKDPNVSTLLVTGDLLKSLQTSVDVASGSAEIAFSGSHYSNLQNSALAAILIAKGFVGWFGFGVKDTELINRRAERFVSRAMRAFVKEQKVKGDG